MWLYVGINEIEMRMKNKITENSVEKKIIISYLQILNDVIVVVR